MISTFCLAAALMASPLAAAPPSSAAPPASLSIDLDGDGAPEQVSAVAKRRTARVEVRSAASGKVVARAEVPAPASKSDGVPEITLSAGSLGSAGALLEVVAASGARECRSVWRLREKSLLRVPLAASPPAADCGARGEWSYGWDQPAADSPAEYRRERTRETGLGPHRKVESFRYAGFRLEIDPVRSSSEIRGVQIPSWYAATLYQRSALDGLYAHYDLSALKKSPRLRFVTDSEQGAFAARLLSSTGERVLPVTKLERGAEPNEVLLTLGSSEPAVRARVALAGKPGVPGEVTLQGAGPDADVLYTPATLVTEGGLHVFATAEDALVTTSLVGSWSGRNAENVTMTLASNDPVLLGIGNLQFSVEVEGAPDGIDALFVPRAGGAPTSGLILRGPNSIERVPVRCETAVPPFGCRPAGPPEVLRRVGGRVNAR
ncbi:MAG: hypothetical protein M3167_12710 [Acidobacteriota bacterium]|nr:hypothetical protein [Acidobacteriota bacterium]